MMMMAMIMMMTMPSVGCVREQVYALSWVEKKLASTFFAKLPTATIDDALKHFLKVQHHPLCCLLVVPSHFSRMPSYSCLPTHFETSIDLNDGWLKRYKLCLYAIIH